jgi:hypothetical protein
MIRVTAAATATICFLSGANALLGRVAGSTTRAMVVWRSPAALVSFRRFTNMS